MKVKIGVDFSNDSIKSEIESGLAERFNSTDRCSTTDSFYDNDIFLHVICVSVKFKDANYNLAVACAARAFYYPFKNTLSYDLGEASSIVTKSPDNLQSMISEFANDLINATTDEKLAEYKKTMTTGIRLVCLSEPATCRLSPLKQ